MPDYNESIFHPKVERRKLGLSDEDMEYIVEFFRWHIQERNLQLDRLRTIAIRSLGDLTSFAAAV